MNEKCLRVLSHDSVLMLCESPPLRVIYSASSTRRVLADGGFRLNYGVVYALRTRELGGCFLFLLTLWCVCSLPAMALLKQPRSPVK